MNSEQRSTENERTWEQVKADPEVVAAHAALDAHEAEEKRLMLNLGRAIRNAQARAIPSGEAS